MHSTNIVFKLFKSPRKKKLSKLYVIARGHWFPFYDLGNECA